MFVKENTDKKNFQSLHYRLYEKQKKMSKKMRSHFIKRLLLEVGTKKLKKLLYEFKPEDTHTFIEIRTLNY